MDLVILDTAYDVFVRLARDVLRSETPLTTQQRFDTAHLGDPADRAREIISCTDGYGFDERRALTKRLVYEVVLQGLEERILRLFESVRFFMPNNIPIRRLAEEAAWRAMLALIVQYQIGDGDVRPLEERQFRDVPVARAAGRLRARRFDIAIAGDSFRVEQAEAERLWRYIAAQTSLRTDHERLLRRLFERIARFWRPEIERYVIPRFLGTVPTKLEPTTPFNYVLQLAARYWANKIIVPGAPVALPDDELISLTTDVVAVFDIEPYSVHELLFPNASRYLELLTSVAQFQAAIDLPQRPAADLVPLLRNLLCWLPGSADEALLSFTVDQLLTFVEAFIAATKQEIGPTTVSCQAIEACLTVSVPKEALRALWSAFVHDAGTVNVAFASPLDWRAATFVTKPFIWQGPNYVAFADRALAMESLLIAALKTVNAAIPLANERIGLIGFETYVRNLLGVGGHRVISGAYEEGEIDALVETDDAIIVIECKKRMLGVDALAGDRGEVVRELVGTVAKAHEQMLRVERRLLETGTIDVGASTVQLKGRDIFRVAVSLHDWGIFHDQSVLSYMLTSLVAIRVGHRGIQESDAKWVAEVNGIAERLTQHAQTIASLKKGRDRQPFWNSAFLPVGALHLMLDRKGDVVKLAERLKARLHMITGNLDVYADFEQFGNL